MFFIQSSNVLGSHMNLHSELTCLYVSNVSKWH